MEGSDPIQAFAARPLAAKAWTAYIRLVLVAAPLVVVVPVAWAIGSSVGVVVLAAASGYLLYLATHIRSCRLYADEEGVWVEVGALPWTKSIAGVQWRDLGEVLVENGLWSWLAPSYTLRMPHRFSPANDIVLTDMAGAHLAAGVVNAARVERLRRDAVRRDLSMSTGGE